MTILKIFRYKLILKEHNSKVLPIKRKNYNKNITTINTNDKGLTFELKKFILLTLFQNITKKINKQNKKNIIKYLF